MENIMSKIQQNIEEQFNNIYSIEGINKETNLLEKFNEKLNKISSMIRNKEINPENEIIVSSNIQNNDIKIIDKYMRIGVFPTAGNPMHWAHILTALDAIIEQKLDKVVFVIAGEDEWKPDLVLINIRYPMNKEILSLFEPLFVFSDIANIADEEGNLKLRGEYNIFRILKLNPKQKIDAFYLVGSDHLNRYVIVDGIKRKDTVGCLEDNIENKIYSFNSEIHSVNALFIARNIEEFKTKKEEVGKASINIVELIPTTSTSSTSIRKALDGTGPLQALEFLPYITYKRIKDNKIYGCK
jgi:nicotinic acid mononucleotide adenylyltransferase